MAKDPYRYFRIEAGDLLSQLAKSALDLEKSNSGADAVLRLLRLAHTLKGAARVVKQAEIAEIAHRIEDILSPFRDGTQALPRADVDKVLAAIDEITACIARLPTPDAPNVPATAMATPLPADVGHTAVRIVRADLLEVDILLEGLGEIGNELGGVRRAVASMERIGNLATQMTSNHAMPVAKLKSISDEIQTMAATLERTMSASVLRMDREIRETRDAAERLRLVPISGIFNTLERTARDAAHSMNKLVEFAAIGGDVRIDGTVLDAVQSALIQMVRNAVAHGIEPPAQRTAAGKASAGRIVVEVERHGYRALFRCKDDGAGIDLDAVRKIVKKNNATNVSTSEHAQKIDEKGLLGILLKGGISTAAAITEIAGRGIGLNLVSEMMQGLNGEVCAHTERGKGTAIELWVPLSLAALAVLIVENRGCVAALPFDAVKRTLRLSPRDIVRSAEGESILYEGRQIPFVPFPLGAPQKAARMPTASSLRRMTAVVLASADGIVALAVERLRGMDNVILRALPPLCPADPIVLGVYIDSEGNPCMVLDPEVLIAPRTPDHVEAILQKPGASVAPILIIDDSLTTRMLESSILESAGFSVELASSAEEGLEKARRNRYALFLVDVEMPGMNGFSFVERTQADPALRDVPSVLVTSLNSAEDRLRGKACGARGHIVKGEFDQIEFLARVSELVQR